MSNVDRFMDSIESPNTHKVVKATIINSSHNWNDLENYKNRERESPWF